MHSRTQTYSGNTDIKDNNDITNNLYDLERDPVTATDTHTDTDTNTTPDRRPQAHTQ